MQRVSFKRTDEFILNVDFLCQSLLAGSYDFLIICNPNNPTSSAILRSDMERSSLHFANSMTFFVMIDETYVEFAPVIEDVTAVPFTKTFKNLMVLRGVSKFFAAPGVRLGYGITGNMPFLKAMKEKQIPCLEQPRRFCRRTHAERRRIYQTDPPSHSFRTGKNVLCFKRAACL